MKKLFIFLILILLTFFVKAQTFPITQNLGSPTTLIRVKGGIMADSGFVNAIFVDTTAANLNPYIKNYVGAAIFTTSDNTVWVRNAAATAWVAQAGATNITINNIYNNSTTGISIINQGDSSVTISICTGSGVCDTTTLATNVTYKIGTFVSFIDSSHISICGTDSSTLEYSCDTLSVPVQRIYVFQNGLQQSISGVVELGGNIVHNTTLASGYNTVNFTGNPIYKFPYQFSQNAYFTIGSGLVSFKGRGSNRNGSSFINNLVKLGIQYTEDSASTSPDYLGYYGNNTGYFLSTNLNPSIIQGSPSIYSMNLDDVNSKYSGIFFNTKDTANDEAGSLFGAPPTYSTTYIHNLDTAKALVWRTNKDIRLPNYPDTRNDGVLTKVLGTDANGNVLLGTVGAGSGVTNLTATDNYAQTWTISNPTTTPNLSLVLDTTLYSTRAFANSQFLKISDYENFANSDLTFPNGMVREHDLNGSILKLNNASNILLKSSYGGGSLGMIQSSTSGTSMSYDAALTGNHALSYIGVNNRNDAGIDMFAYNPATSLSEIFITPTAFDIFADSLRVTTLVNSPGTKDVRYNPTTGLITYTDTTIGGGSTSLAGLTTDVNISSPSNLQLLQYQTGDNKWHNWTPNYLSSVDTTNISNFSVKVRSLLSATAPITYNSGTGAIGITQATTSTNGYLSNTDWNTFNGKLSSVDTTNISNFYTKVRSLLSLTTTGTSGAATYNSGTGVLNIPQYAGGGGTTWGSITGTLSSQTDLQTALNGKEPTITAPNTIYKYWNGYRQFVSLNTDSISEGSTNKFYTDTRARASLSFTAGSGAYNNSTGVVTIPTNTSQLTNGAGFLSSVDTTNIPNFYTKVRSLYTVTAPITYNSGTGLIGITQANTSTNGYLSSADWNTFNGKLSGNQTITLSGDVTGSGTTAIATTIANSAVTLAKMANMATGSLIYRKTAGTGVPEVNTLATLKTDLGLTGTNSGDQTITLTGNVTGSGTGSFATTIANNVVTNAMLAGSIALSKLSITGTPDGTKFLRDDGSWQTISSGGITTVGTINSQTKSSNGAVISGSNIYMQTADHTYPGLMSAADKMRLDSNYYLLYDSLYTKIAKLKNDTTLKIKSIRLQKNGSTISPTETDTTALWNVTIDTTDISNFYLKVRAGLAASSPITFTNGSIGISQATTSTNGYLSSTDWNTFNGKQNAITFGDITSTTVGLTITNGIGVVKSPGTAINISYATTSTNGLLSMLDWNRFSNMVDSIWHVPGADSIKYRRGNTIYAIKDSVGTGGGGTGSNLSWNSGTHAVDIDGGGTSATIPVADATHTGVLSSTDWSTFNGKQDAITASNTANKYWNGYKNFVSLNTDSISEGGTNKFYTDARARLALSFTAGSGGYNNSTGVITIPTNTNQLTNGSGFLSSIDTSNISNFYSKVRSLLSFSAGSGAYNSGTGVITIPTNTNQLTNGAGFITGNQSITLSGDISGTGTTAITTTIGPLKVATGMIQANAVTLAKMDASTATANKMLLSQSSSSPIWSTSTIPSSAGATANKVLLSNGTNYVLSTPTFPNASATSRKIIVSDGTNWVASTETYAVPGTSGNIMLSNGTNWTSSTAPTWNQNTTGSAATLTTTRTIWGQNFNGSANVSGTLALGSSNLTMTGSLAATGSRVTKGWFTDVESTNMPTVGGTSLTTVAETFQNKTITNSNNVLGGVTMTFGSDANYDIYYRNSSGILTRLPAGTDGNVLTTHSTTSAPAWTAASGGISSIGAINSQTKSANGAVISGSSLVMQTADASNPGLQSPAQYSFIDSIKNHSSYLKGNKTYDSLFWKKNDSTGVVKSIRLQANASAITPTTTDSTLSYNIPAATTSADGVLTAANYKILRDTCVIKVRTATATTVDFTTATRAIRYDNGGTWSINPINDNVTVNVVAGALKTISSEAIIKYISLGGDDIDSIVVSNNIGLGYLDISNNAIKALDVTSNINLTWLDAHNNSLTQASVNAILVALDGIGKTNGKLRLDGNTAPNGAGSTAKTSLISKGWSVTTD